MINPSELSQLIGYELRLLEMVASNLNWITHRDGHLVKGVDIQYFKHDNLITRFDGPRELVIPHGHLTSPAPWIGQFLPLIFITAHKMLELVFSEIAEVNHLEYDGKGNRTAGVLGFHYQNALEKGLVELPPVWHQWPSVHKAMFMTWHSLTPQRNNQVHRGGVVLDERGTLVLQSKKGRKIPFEDREVEHFVMASLYAVQALLHSGSKAEAYMAGVAKRLESFYHTHNVNFTGLQSQWWLVANVHLDLATLIETGIYCKKMREEAVEEWAPDEEDEQRFELLVVINHEEGYMQVPEPIFREADRIFYNPQEKNWATKKA